MARTLLVLLAFLVVTPLYAEEETTSVTTDRLPYAIVDTGQQRCWDARREIRYPSSGKPFFGQDAQYVGNEARYEVREHTVLDLVTGLEWQRDPGPKKTFRQAVAGAMVCDLAGHDDWRLPSIKELYSLILFSGRDVGPQSSPDGDNRPFIHEAFAFAYGDVEKGERIIDSQWATITRYVSTTMGGNETMFGVNFADGRIKGYPTTAPRGRGDKAFFCIYVRGNPSYGKNDFVDNGDGTITDRATGLTWMKQDSGHLRAGPRKDGRMNWEEALVFAEALDHAAHDDWRLPNAKELHSIVDYTRSPDTTKSAAIDPVFEVSQIPGDDGGKDYPFFWSSTTHASERGGQAAAYVAFGRGTGWMPDRRGGGDARLLDVHGAGCQRSDPKDGDPAETPRGMGPQGDVRRILNHVRCVRGGKAEPRSEGPALEPIRARPRGGRDGQAGRPGGRTEGGSEGPRKGGRFVARLDRDGDGRISREEFDGPPEHFDHLDRDGDGYISEDEAPTGPPPGGRGGPGSPGGRPQGPGGPR